jgi:RHH-type rel operon transcriptional repressor/antitoxin RelB
MELFMNSATISARISDETAQNLEKLAKSTKRSKSYLAGEAIQAYIEDQLWQIEAIKKGIEEADKGNFASDKEIKKTLKKWKVNINED